MTPPIKTEILIWIDHEETQLKGTISRLNEDSQTTAELDVALQILARIKELTLTLP